MNVVLVYMQLSARSLLPARADSDLQGPNALRLIAEGVFVSKMCTSKTLLLAINQRKLQQFGPRLALLLLDTDWRPQSIKRGCSSFD